MWLLFFSFITLVLFAGDKRSQQTILGQRHFINCIARFFQNLSTFWDNRVVPTNMHGMWLRRP